MDSVDLLARENEFKKLNKQLEKKTESLMKQIENAMQNQDIFSDFNKNLSLNESIITKKHCCESSKITPVSSNSDKSKNARKNSPKSLKDAESLSNSKNVNLTQNSNVHSCDLVNNCNHSDDYCNRSKRFDDYHEFLQAFVIMNVQDNVLPKSFNKDDVTVESVCKFLSSKCKLLQEQIHRLQATINAKTEQCERHLKSQAELEGERMSLLNRANNLAAEAADTRAKHLAAQHRCNEKEKLYKEQRSECDKMSCEVKRLRADNSRLEARCARLEHCVDTLTQQLHTANKAEQEYRDSCRSVAIEHQTAISVLEMRIKNQKSRLYKQNALIDNLRKQNALLLTKGALDALEGKYCTFIKEFH